MVIEGRFGQQTHTYKNPTTRGALALAESAQTKPQLRLVQDVQPHLPVVDELALRRQKNHERATVYRPLLENRHQSVIASDLQELTELQRQFDAALGRSYDSQDLLQRSYNPVIDVLHIQQLRRRGDEKGEQAHMREISLNMETNLRERYKVSKSTINYYIDGRDIYSEHFPQESFDKVLERGVEYRLQHNTPEAEREGMLGELGGWKIIQDKLTDPRTEVGTKMTAFSPPGLVENTAYTGKFVDEYELSVNEKGERYVKLTRHAVTFGEQEYRDAALSLDQSYFDGYDGRPWDAWMLSHPVEGALNLSEQHMDASADFVPDLTSGKLLSFLNYYKDALREEPIDWEKIALTFNAILNQADEEQDAYSNGGELPSSSEMPISQSAVREAINIKGRQEVKTVMGGGCPPNKGFNMASLVGLNRGSSAEVREPGVSKFAAENFGGKTLHCKSCPMCGAIEIDATIKDGKIICPINGCSAPYVC